ncbi:putative B-cell antigen receptor complex-associated protein alpha chain [Scophthalmus maximus]|uniref:CD79a molecule, immunoglobulin-associated alpha n=1 Tax=Scophthalmus maximus TaxID=52904 RepID=A0A2U9AXB5_SCOMX|nr:B-cell antigen receptor complex-associated protein alpha chain isoform X2 [Scophthalmus maximus]AWO96319.1 putative B-cell antigen receptor complex-associated protein alpha chain [Scophthalmus maximus]
MAIAAILVLCSFAVITQSEVTLQADVPYLRVSLSHRAVLECCYNTSGKSVKHTWVKSFKVAKESFGPLAVNFSEHVFEGFKTKSGCSTLTLRSVQLNDTGMYQCWLNSSDIRLFSHGTYLQVFKPLEKTLNLSESTKNKILTAEGVLLLLCVLLPSTTLLCKSKKLHELEKKKARKEEDNIYQGLNLDDCCSTYDKIERSKAHGPYQDVCNTMEDEEEIQLEQP